MKLDFSKFKAAVTRQFDEMTKHDMFRTAVGKDELWEQYLSSFPPGTNPMFRERTEHDCSCCRQFIRAVGDAVAIVDGEVVSIWDVTVDQQAYHQVAARMSHLVKSHKIEDVFLHPDKSAGTDRNFENDNGEIRLWDHFHVAIPWGRNVGHNYLCPGEDIASTLGVCRATRDVLLRGLTELTQDSVDTVLDIIGQNSLYRGNEYEASLRAFDKLKRQFDQLRTDSERDLFAWANFDKVHASAARLRNTAIGTLLIDLSEGTDLEEAVRKFETSIMAPSNYKRPTALVSQRMVDDARKAVEEMGLTSALERRYARLDDISVNDIIFVDRSARKRMKGGAFEGIANKPKKMDVDTVEVLPIEEFIKKVVPNVESIEVFLDNSHTGNLVSLIAPVHKDAKSLFKWGNGFSYAYNGDVADSIKERVKSAGGNVTGDLCCRLAWRNYDDLDFHMVEPNGYEIFFGNRGRISSGGGQLDVDMNAGVGTTREPVENIYYGDRRMMMEGPYHLFVHQFRKQEDKDVGFEVEVDYLGDVRRFAYEKAVRLKENVTVMKFKYTHKDGIEVLESLPATTMSRTVWNLKTQDFHKVNVLMLSPNHWDGEAGIGNKHWFFMLDGCANDGEARGFFNEFLRPELDKHRKVIEIVGSKMKVAAGVDQLSGLGFSDTRRAELLVRVKGNITRVLKVAI